jgi:arylformamidase
VLRQPQHERFWAAWAVAVALIASAPAQAPPRERIAARLAEPSAPGGVEYAYGGQPLQRLDFWQARGKAPAPLVIFVHGGGWRRGDKGNATGAAKVTHLLARGYAVASIDYRLVPEATVEQQAADIVLALFWLTSNAARFGIDPARVVLMGHSAGAHLVALVGTDPRYLNASGLSFAALRGIVAIDGAGYDVPRQIADAGGLMRATYARAFGSDVARRRRLSPTFQAAAPNAPAFLILHVARRDGTAQAIAFAQALQAAGTPAERRGFAGNGLHGHIEINRRLGDPSYPATAVLDAWLAKRFAVR